MHFEGKDGNEKPFHTNSAGTYQICLDNTMSKFTAKVVSLEVDGSCSHAAWTTLDGTTAPAAQQKAPDDLVTKDDLTPVERSVERIERTLKNIADLQHSYRWHEIRSRSTAESTCERVLWYSLLVIAMAVVMTVGQVFILKYWFRR